MSKRTSSATFMCTPLLKAELQERAKTYGLSLSAVIVQILEANIDAPLSGAWFSKWQTAYATAA